MPIYPRFVPWLSLPTAVAGKASRRRGAVGFAASLVCAVTLCIAFASGTANAQIGGPDAGGVGGGAARPAVLTSALLSNTAVPPGGRAVIAVVLDHAEPWHTWPAAELDVLPANIAEFAIHTAIEVDAGDFVRKGAVQWPKPKVAAVANPDVDPPTIDVPLFAGLAVAYVPIRVSENATPGERVSFGLMLSYQACDDTTCLVPMSDEFTLSFVVAATGAPDVAIGASADAALFAGFDPAGFGSVLMGAPGGADAVSGGAGRADGPGEAESGSVSDASAPAVGPRFFGLQLPDPRGPVGLVVLLVVSAVGGFVLNLTPCVLPVIPIKVMTLTKHAGSRSRAMVLGLWMALGVVAFWVGVGLPVAFLSGVTDPSAIFRHWPVTMGIGVVIALMGLGILGLFSINLPQGVYAINPKADSPGGSFVFGVMTALLGLPCFGFVVGGLLPAAAPLGAFVVLTIFAGLGIGMAAPYFVLSAKPGLVEKLPRTGPASDLVKQVMGLLLLAAAAFFVAVSIKTLLKGRPYLSESIQWWGVAVFVVAASGLLVARTFAITRKAGRRAIFSAIGLGMAATFVGVAMSLTGAARERYDDRRAALAASEGAGGGQVVPGVWLKYSPGAMQAARDGGFTVFLDFTADWCINCKALKNRVLDGHTVRARFAKGDVVIFEVDIDYPEGKRLFDQFGRAGIPAWAVLAPGQSEPVFIDTFVPSEVVSRLDAAEAVSSAR